MSRMLTVVLSLLLVADVASGQAPLTQVTVDEAVRLALERNATLRAKALGHQATRTGEITAALRPNPTAAYAAEQLAPGGAEQATVQHTVIVSQTIETGGKRRRRIDSAQAATRVSEYDLADQRRQTVFQVKKAFTDVLMAQEALALAQANLRTLDELERLQRLRAERGDISELELTRIQVQRFAFERDAADAAQALRAAKISLRSAVDPSVLAEDVMVIGDLVFREVAVDRADLYRRALTNRPDILAADAGREKAGADARLARANAAWDFAPLLEYQRIGADNTLGVGFRLPIRIFDRNQGEIARTRIEMERADALRRAVAIQALAEIDTTLASLVTEREKISALERIYLPKARQARDTVEYAYRRGGLSLLDFLDAERTYRETALERIRALGNYQSAINQLEAAIGGPLAGRP